MSQRGIFTGLRIEDIDWVGTVDQFLLSTLVRVPVEARGEIHDTAVMTFSVEGRSYRLLLMGFSWRTQIYPSDYVRVAVSVASMIGHDEDVSAFCRGCYPLPEFELSIEFQGSPPNNPTLILTQPRLTHIGSSTSTDTFTSLYDSELHVGAIHRLQASP